jgi:hypothetical protein
VDPRTGVRTRLAGDAYAAALAGGRLVVETARGGLAVIEVATGHRREVTAPGGIPMRAGSTATAGAEGPPGSIALAPGGRPSGRSLHHLDPRSAVVLAAGEDAR